METKSYRQIGTNQGYKDNNTNITAANTSTFKVRGINSQTASSSTASKPKAPCSIPSKFEPKKASRGPEKNAFGGRTHRFNKETTSQPGPGYYHKPITYIKDSKTCGSVSARGFTSMISKSSRFNIYEEIKILNDASLPGPASYNLISVGNGGSGGGDANQNQNQFPQSMFAKPRHYRDEIFVVTECDPGPGAYDLDRTKREEVIKQQEGSSMFKDESKRFRRVKPQTDHAPGSYNVGSAMDALNDYGKKDTGASFRSKSNRGDFFIKNKDLPGPGDYRPEISDKIMLKVGDKNPTPAFSATQSDRFGNFNGSTTKKGEKGVAPGPGWYEPGDAAKINEEGASSAFRSGSKRLGGKMEDRYKPPGPAYYNVKPEMQKSFHLNMAQKWVG